MVGNPPTATKKIQLQRGVQISTPSSAETKQENSIIHAIITLSGTPFVAADPTALDGT